MNAMDTQRLLAATLEKIASRKEAEKEDKKDEKKEDKPVKGTGDCGYAMKVADSIDYLLKHADVWLGSPIDKVLSKEATSDSVPNMLPNSPSTGPDGRPINWKRDSMAVGEQPAAQPGTGTHSSLESGPNAIKTTLDKKPGGADVNPASTPLLNKSAFQKVLSKLASNKVATSDEVPNALRTMDSTESGKGQSGYDSSGFGNENRHLVDTSNEKAQDYTKGDAKKHYNKEQMSQVMDEVHPEKDTALDRAFTHGVEGAKLAGIEDAMKLKRMAEKEVKEEKKEEKVAPGIHKKIEKEAGISDLAGRALGGAAGLATKAHEAGGRALSGAGKALNTDVFMTPEHLLSMGAAPLLGGASTGLGARASGIDEDSSPSHVGGAALGGALGVIPGAALTGLGKSRIGLPLAALGGLAGAYGGGQLGKGIGNLAGSGEKTAEEKCTCNGKGTCKCCKEKTEKMASLLVHMKQAQEQVPTNMPAGGTQDVTNQVAPSPEQAMPGQEGMGGEAEQIEKVKRLLLALQMLKKQQEMGAAGSTGAMPGGSMDQASPGAGSASEMTAGMAGPTQGVL